MVNARFPDAALVLIGHGSTKNTDSVMPVYQHAAELRRRALFAEVREAFWQQEPGIRSVIDGLKNPRVFVVPLMISEGYFTRQVIPAELGITLSADDPLPRQEPRDGQALYYCPPAGVHPSLTEVILARAREVLDKYPFPRAPRESETALFIAGHGTGRNENSRRAVERHVALIRERKLYGRVHAVFMEEAPWIGDCYTLAPEKNLVVVPCFMSDGLHVAQDIPVLLGEPERLVLERLKTGQPTWRNPTEKNGKRVWYARALGTEPHLADVILQLVSEAAAENSRT